MNRILILLLAVSISTNVKGQVEKSSQGLISKASLFHLQKDYKNAIIYFERAFELQRPDALSAYKAAGAYSLDSNNLKAFDYLNLALSLGWTEADWLSFDPYFDYLRNSRPGKWRRLEKKVFSKERKYVQRLKLPALRKQINLMTINDQKLRYKRIQTRDKNEIGIINKQIGESDLKNLSTAKAIIKQYDWPKISDIGKDGQNNLWLIIQHADHDVLFQQTTLLGMEKLKGTSEINMENYAFLYDRVQCNLNFKQLYGTQVNWTSNGKASGFRPIIRENLVDIRRKEVGLSPLSIYALTYDFQYNNRSALQAKESDSTDIASAKQLINSANYFYEKSEFQKTYDYYNNASTIQGGMTSAENYDAAIVFSKIYSFNNEPKYKDIALDFLTLLYQRQELNKVELEEQPSFNILHREQRWTDFFRPLK